MYLEFKRGRRDGRAVTPNPAMGPPPAPVGNSSPGIPMRGSSLAAPGSSSGVNGGAPSADGDALTALPRFDGQFDRGGLGNGANVPGARRSFGRVGSGGRLE